MKKKLLAGALVLTLLTGGTLATYSASQSEVLVSRSYINGIFWSDLKATVKQEVVRDTTAFYNEIAAQAGQSGGEFQLLCRPHRSQWRYRHWHNRLRPYLDIWERLGAQWRSGGCHHRQ